MKTTIFRFTKLSCAIAFGLMVSQGHLALAGWTGTMNSSGYGKASVNVTSSEKSKTITTPNINNPSATMTYAAGYYLQSSLPSGASAATVSQVKGEPGYIWQANTVGSNGDSTDNHELESRVRIVAADCASLEMTSSADIDTDAKSGTITVKAKGTAGTAIWLRGYEYSGTLPDFGTPLPPPDEGYDLPAPPETDAFLEFLKANGTLKWDVLYVGPFALDDTCSAIKIPFTYETSPENVYFVTDGVAKSLPLVIQCPNDIVVDCQQSVNYPATVQVGGCGNITVTFNPAAPDGGTFPPGSFPVGTTPVTVTATDKDGNTTNCTFNVIVTDTTKPVIPELPNLTGEASVTITEAPTATDNCAGVITGQTTSPLPLVFNTQGTTTVPWTFDDGNGNITTVNQIVIVDDVTDPVTPTIADATGECSVTVTPPTTTDNVAGTVTGTTSDPLTYTTQGTFVITWTFNDGNGNATTATQTVIVDDTIAPVAPTSLPIVTGSCSTPVTLTAPTATDNCKGTVIGTTTTTFPITTPGTTIVTWTFNDGNGNTSAVTQTVEMSGLVFHGFYSPIGGTNGTCAKPLRTANLGNNLPVKFDVECGGSRYVDGLPTMTIEKSSTDCTTLSPVSQGQFTLVGNEWHFNWDTASGGVTAGNYKLTATLQDGTQRYVWIKLK